MNNPHIIVGEGHRCLCGQYGDKSIPCYAVLAALQHLESFRDPRQKESLDILRAVLESLLEDRAGQPMPSGTPLAAEALQLCYAIENLPASSEQTQASVCASALREKLQAKQL
jgi:hypothetical protein